MCIRDSVWVQYGCIVIRLKKGAVNVVDAIHVFKWKKKTVPAGTPRRRTTKTVRFIRCRMALRGFKEWCAHELETYAGTAKRQSQKIVASESACHPDWVYSSLDAEKAFLQGLTFEELAQATGEPLRVVNFATAAHSRQAAAYPRLSAL